MPAPHNAERYVELFRAAYRTKRIIKIRGQFAGILGSFRVSSSEDFYYGELFKFFDLKISGKWLNVNEQAPAEENELLELNVPEHLKPGLEAFPFIFHPKSHKIFFISQEINEHLGPMDAGRYFRALLNQPRLSEKFGEITVTVIPDADTLDKILNLPDLRRLHIEISPPNPDDLEELEQEIRERLNEQKAAKMLTILVAEKGKSLAPDEQTKLLSQVAQTNGYVEARGATETGKVETFSTKSHPLKDPVQYDPNVETVLTALFGAAERYYARVRRQNGARRG